MTKPELRSKYKALRKQLSLDDVEHLSMEIANKLLTLNIWNFSYYHVFLSMTDKKEINTDYILHILQGKDKNIVVSKSNMDDGSMVHFLLTDSTQIKKNNYGIPEPVDGIEIPEMKLDVVFVPLLAFDIKGNRIGYGKGYYDRFLRNCKPDVLKIGLSFFEAEENLIEGMTNHDVALDYCITPFSISSFEV